MAAIVIGFLLVKLFVLALMNRSMPIPLAERHHRGYRDRARMIAVIKEGRQQLEEQMARERAEREERRRQGDEEETGWEPAPRE